MSTGNYSFREATIDDLPLILKWTEQLMEHERLDDNIELQLNNKINSLLEEWLKNLISDNNTLIIVASEEAKDRDIPAGLIIGYLQLQPNNFTQYEFHGVIQMVWVEKQYRNSGLATQLLDYIEAIFKDMAIPYCEIQYSDSNSEAEAFWMKSGYQKVSHSCRKILN